MTQKQNGQSVVKTLTRSDRPVSQSVSDSVKGGWPTDDVNGWPLHYAARLIYSESPPVIEVMILLSFCIPSFPPPPPLLAHHPECCCGRT